MRQRGIDRDTNGLGVVLLVVCTATMGGLIASYALRLIGIF